MEAVLYVLLATLSYCPAPYLERDMAKLSTKDETERTDVGDGISVLTPDSTISLVWNLELTRKTPTPADVEKNWPYTARTYSADWWLVVSNLAPLSA